MDERELLIALNAGGHLSRAALCRLAKDTACWWRAPDDRAADSLAAKLGVPREQLRRALNLRPRAPELAARELKRAARLECRIITCNDAEYPRRLCDLALPPPVLTCRGRIPEGPAIAVVGSRKMTPYGREATEMFAARLAAAGITVVSGFARGIDTAAHRAALTIADGRTVAVLGCGVDIEYPRGSTRLAAAVARHGAVVSEFPLGCRPLPWQFPIRNRVIAALAAGTLVVEAAQKSGSLITAHHALELGRDVYAVPGRIFDELSLGTNALVADGALVARCPEDILESLPLALQGELFPTRPAKGRPAAAPTDPEGPDQALPASVAEPTPTGVAGKVLEALPTGRERTAEDVAGLVGLPVDQVLGALLELELGGWVRREPGPVYVR
ncbi:MAG: DNA-protecting protein DprA [bacterium]|nr:DNA-protecting protein DprA [bacterium]